MNGAGGVGQPRGRNRATPLSEHTGGESDFQGLAPHNAGGVEGNSNLIFGNSRPAEEAQVAMDLLTHVAQMSTLESHDRAGERELAALGNHQSVSQGTAEQLVSHENLPGSSSGEYKLEEGTYLGLHIVAYKLMISDALQNTKGYPVVYQFYQGLALVVCDLAWVQAGGYSDKERAEIKIAQIKMTKENWDDIVRVLSQRPMNYMYVTQFLMEKTGGMIMVLDPSAGNPLQRLDRMVKAYDRCSKEIDHNALVRKFEEKEKYNRSEGSGHFGLTQDLQRIVFDEYLNAHSVVREDIKVSPNHYITAYRGDFSDNPSNEEFVAREVAACVRNGIRSGTRVFEYFWSEYPEQCRDEYIGSVIASGIQKAIAVEYILEPCVPIYDSSKSPEEILDMEIYAASFNMPKEDQHSVSKVMEYLRVYRDIFHVKATRPGGAEARNISERVLYAYVKKLIEDERLSLSYDEETHIDRILENELVAYQLNKPEGALQNYETVEAFGEYLKKKRSILRIEGTRGEDDEPKKISEKELEEFLNKLIKRGVMPEKGEAKAERIENLGDAWEDYLSAEFNEKAEADPKIEAAFRARVFAKGVTQRALDDFFNKLRPKKISIPQIVVEPIVPSIVPEIRDRAAVFDALRREWKAYMDTTPRGNYQDWVAAFRGMTVSGATEAELSSFFRSEKAEGKGPR